MSESIDLNVLVVGCGNMGTSHAKAYDQLAGVNIVGLVSRGSGSRERLSGELGDLPTFDNYEKALGKTKPDVVSVNTYQSTHADYSIKALESGAHVFVEKPLAENVDEAKQVVQTAQKTNKKLLVGYILRHHPGWKMFINQAKSLGKPLVMRMNLNQQSDGSQWQTHKKLMLTMTPIVDCGVHYVDIMCQMSEADPVSAHAIGARLTDEIDPEMYNYGQLQVIFSDGSVGWYESGWGPMISEIAYFVKDVIGPRGSISIVKDTANEPRGISADIREHTIVNKLHLHHSDLKDDEKLAKEDEFIDAPDEPGHDRLCYLEQQYFINAIRNDVDLSGHMEDAIKTLQVVLACDESVKTGRKIFL